MKSQSLLLYEAFYLQLAIIDLFSKIHYLSIYLSTVSKLDYSLYPKYILLNFKLDPVSFVLKTLAVYSHYIVLTVKSIELVLDPACALTHLHHPSFFSGAATHWAFLLPRLPKSFHLRASQDCYSFA